MTDETIWLAVLFLIVAALYAAVGQAGASGYLAAMGLFGLAPTVMKPTALALNLLVAGIGTFQFWRSGLFSWRTFYPFAVLGFPFSLLAGSVQLPGHIYYPAVGIILILSGLQMIRSALTKKIAVESAETLPSCRHSSPGRSSASSPARQERAAASSSHRSCSP